MGLLDKLQQESSFSVASGNEYQYVVLQVTLKEKFFGTGSGNLTELEDVINNQAKKVIDYIQFQLLMVEVKDLVEETVSKQLWYLKK